MGRRVKARLEMKMAPTPIYKVSAQNLPFEAER